MEQGPEVAKESGFNQQNLMSVTRAGLEPLQHILLTVIQRFFVHFFKDFYDFKDLK